MNIIKDAIDFVHSSNTEASNSKYHAAVIVAKTNKSIFTARKIHCPIDGLTFVNPRYANFSRTITNDSMTVCLCFWLLYKLNYQNQTTVENEIQTMAVCSSNLY